MKTFRQIFSEVVQSDFVSENVTNVSPEERAAKAYVKQWVEKVAEDAPLYYDSIEGRMQYLMKVNEEINAQ
jgi:hypothetical protein